MQSIRIKHCRLLLSMTQKELAEKVGVSQTLISTIEAGDAPLTIELEQKIYHALEEVGIDMKVVMHSLTILLKQLEDSEVIKS